MIDSGFVRMVSLVAGRELSNLVFKRSFVVSTVVVLVAIIAGLLLYKTTADDRSGHNRVGIVADSSLVAAVENTGHAAGLSIEATVLPDRETAEHDVTNGTLDAALVHDADAQVRVVVKTRLDPTIAAVIAGSVGRGDHAGASPAIKLDILDSAAAIRGQQAMLSAAVVVVLFIQIMMFGIYVAQGVVEEKSSRVVEVLLSTVRPLQLMWGKILGIGAVGLLQLTVFLIGGAIAARVLDVFDTQTPLVGVVASALGWFVLGFLFFAAVYAAAGAMVSRQEDVNATAAPIFVLISLMFIVAFRAVSQPDGALARILSWIPPFSAMLMPVRMAAGTAPVVQVVGAAALMLIATAVIAFAASRIYEGSILRMGRVVSWKSALEMVR